MVFELETRKICSLRHRLIFIWRQRGPREFARGLAGHLTGFCVHQEAMARTRYGVFIMRFWKAMQVTFATVEVEGLDKV